MSGERWRPVRHQNFAMNYMISDQGRIVALRVLDRVLAHPLPISAATRKSDGYKTVFLSSIDTGKMRFYVHHLVLNAFVGAPLAGHVACHNNGNPSDNRAVNLRWDTVSGNHSDKKKHGTESRGDRNGSARLSPADVAKIRVHYSNAMHVRDIASMFGVCEASVYNIIKGKTWSHL